jgi:putative ABC transport system permease protein
MRDIFLDLAVRSVRLNFLRSLLASIGIVIGVVAISSMGMLGTNMQLSVKEQLSSGANTIIIAPDAVKTPQAGATSSSSTLITDTQLREIREAVGTSTVIPIHRTSTRFSIGSTDGRGSIYGLFPDDAATLFTVSNGTMMRGEGDVLVGSMIASNFNIKIGTRIKIGDPKTNTTRPVVRVSGIIPARGMTGDNIMADNAIIVSESWYTSHFGDSKEYD